MASTVSFEEALEMEINHSSLRNHTGKKTWPELQQAVKKSHRSASSVLNRNPHNFSFKHIQNLNGQTTRLYFLGVYPGQRENSLLYVDIDCNEKSEVAAPVQWQRLLDPFQSATAASSLMSKEEQLLRERKRLRSFGITEYDYHEATSTFAFSASNSLFVCLDSMSAEPVIPMEVKTTNSGSRVYSKLCPHNPDLLAFVRDSDLWVTNVANGQEQRLTFVHKGDVDLSEDPLSAGVPSYIVQEEFDRFTGYWWQAGQQHASGGGGLYRILYEEVDESEVEILNIVSHDGHNTNVDKYRYPRAGTTNARCTLKVAEFQLDATGAISNVTERSLTESLCNICPYMEYITRAGWTPDGKNVYAVLVDRNQKKLSLVLIPLELFTSSAQDAGSDVVMRPDDGSIHVNPHVIHEETSDIWLHVHDIVHFLSSSDGVSVIWASETTGFLHLYLLTTNSDNKTQSDGDKDPLKCVALTSGDWEVDSKQVWVDEGRKLVYFQGYKDTPLELHLYVTSYGSPDGAVHRLTQPGFSHSVEMDKACTMFVSTYSSISTPPTSKVYQLKHEAGVTEAVCLASLLPDVEHDFIVPELFSFPADDGQSLHGLLFAPQSDSNSRLVHEADGATRRKYPIIQFVYAGPQVQLVSNSFKAIKFLRLHTLASLGYAVVVVDSKGSHHRGLKFESHICKRLGTVEVEDQVAALQWLVTQHSYLDINRVAIHGWSYGGYISLMGLAQRPDIFKVAVAGAPVTCWRLYDTGYTERYMDLPQNNTDGYKAGSVLERVEQFPSEDKRLLIVHGLIDENVHFYHTSALVDALIKAGKPYQLQVYPGERHGIRNPNANEHYETMLLSFLQENL